MRMSGKTENESLNSIKKMREETWKGVGAWRIELAENLLVKFMIVKNDTIEPVQD